MHTPFHIINEPQSLEYKRFKSSYLWSSLARYMAFIGLGSAVLLAFALQVFCTLFGWHQISLLQLFLASLAFQAVSGWVNARRELVTFLDNGWELNDELIAPSVQRQWESPLDALTSFERCAELASGIGLTKVLGYDKNLSFEQDPFHGTMRLSRYRWSFLGLSIQISIKASQRGAPTIMVESKPGLSVFYFQNGDAYQWTTKIAAQLQNALQETYQQQQDRQRAEVLERKALEAKLAALQAQVEPHFLFNTLANLKYLVRTNQEQALQLLSDLVLYLQTAMPDMRTSSSTVARECDLAKHFLNIMKIRMGDRLSFSISCPAELGPLAIPPAMLISLVENAIKHGLEKATRKGEVHIIVTRKQQHLVLNVWDDGVGLGDFGGNGVGLSNLHERLRLIYGDRAELIIGPREPTGVEASLCFPLAD